MTRHSRNCTANAVYSYHEKRNDGKSSGFGSLKMRYSKDAVKDFDCCCLTLHPCREPMVTQDGYLFDKESILEYIIAKKNEASRKLKEWEKQCSKEKAELHELGAAEERSKMEKFIKNESSVAVASQAAVAGVANRLAAAGPSNSISNMSTGVAKKLPSFWVPSQTPDSKDGKLEKPDKTVYCPMSGRPLRFKDLFPVKFHQIDPKEDKLKLEGKNDRFKCPVTGDLLRNNIPTAVIKTTGDVVTEECVKLIRKDMRHPLNGQLLKESDIIYLKRGGTGFAETNQELTGTKARPVMQA